MGQNGFFLSFVFWSAAVLNKLCLIKKPIGIFAFQFLVLIDVCNVKTRVLIFFRKQL